MTETARGIVLRTQRLTETSLIIRWLTSEAGRIATVARGALRPKSVFAGKLDLLVEAELTYKRSKRSELHALVELAPLNYHLMFRNDVRRLEMAAYCIALLEQTTEVDTPLPGLFDLFAGLLNQLEIAGARPRQIFAFELKLLALLGLSPDWQNTNLQPGTRELAINLVKESWAGIQDLNPAPKSIKELNNFLHGFLIYHLGKFPRNRASVVRMETGDSRQAAPS